MAKALNILLALALAGVLGLNWVIRPNPAERNAEVLAEMVNSAALETQSDYPGLDGGSASLLPVEGTVARGHMPLRYGATPEEARRAGAELKNPLPADDQAAVDRGAVVYGNFCAVCHGPAGAGNGTVTARGVPPPPSLSAENAVNMADGQMFHVITYGQKNMPPYAAQVGRDDRWRAILYVRSLQKKEKDAAGRAAAAPPARQEVRK